MSHLSPARWLAALPAITALSAAAQGAAPPDSSGSLTYRSAFENYQRFQDGPPLDWRRANDTVRERGGWRAYAKEGATVEPGSTDSPAAGTDPHAGHAGHGTHPPPPPRGKEQR